MKKRKNADDELKKIIIQEEEQKIVALPDPSLFHHEFSSEFDAKMRTLIKESKRQKH